MAAPTLVLAVDVGNTHSVIGLLALPLSMEGQGKDTSDGDIVHTFRISTLPRTTDEFGALLLQLLAQRGVLAEQIRGSVCSSVVPSQVYTVEKAVRRYLDIDCLVVGRKLKTGMRIRTENPREVGADRIVNAVAAITRFGGPVIVVDLGTATTFDCVDANNDYVGGVIAPGLRISEEALYTRTAQLPRIELTKPQTVIGKNTVHAMQSGLFYGYLGLVDALVDRCQAELGGQAQVVATGGYANLLVPESSRVQHIDPFLTLRGLGILYARNVE